ncbi:hypothetical protein ACIBK5_43545, partial [Streptomyces sp. NPDC050546]
LDYLGRLDHQIKIRGQRIEPAEIDTALQTHPGVTRAVTVTHPAPDGSLHLAAYYTSATPLAAAELRAHLRDRLPAAMVPTYLTHLADLPLLPNGKTDRKQLPPPAESADGEPETEYVAPRNELEEELGADLDRGARSAEDRRCARRLPRAGRPLAARRTNRLPRP